MNNNRHRYIEVATERPKTIQLAMAGSALDFDTCEASTIKDFFRILQHCPTFRSGPEISESKVRHYFKMPGLKIIDEMAQIALVPMLALRHSYSLSEIHSARSVVGKFATFL
jgi:hypothetical protein